MHIGLFVGCLLWAACAGDGESGDSVNQLEISETTLAYLRVVDDAIGELDGKVNTAALGSELELELVELVDQLTSVIEQTDVQTIVNDWELLNLAWIAGTPYEVTSATLTTSVKLAGIPHFEVLSQTAKATRGTTHDLPTIECGMNCLTSLYTTILADLSLSALWEATPVVGAGASQFLNGSSSGHLYPACMEWQSAECNITHLLSAASNWSEAALWMATDDLGLSALLKVLALIQTVSVIASEGRQYLVSCNAFLTEQCVPDEQPTDTETGSATDTPDAGSASNSASDSAAGSDIDGGKS